MRHSNSPVAKVVFQPAPKPEPRPPAPRTRISRSSIKEPSHSAKIAAAKQLRAKSKQPKARNAKRRKSEFARTFHSQTRVLWIKAQPCVVSGLRSEIENVHVRGGGGSRRADYRWIVPMTAYLHHELHCRGIKSFEDRHNVCLEREADRTHSRWEDAAERLGIDA